ncbi:MAG: MFS transporter [Gammaproteobacteria bacterium]|nr:MFS transporter [Gammaproteobacteria bacterium]
MLSRLLLGDPDLPVDVNSFRSLSAAMLMAVIGPEVFIVQPGFVQGLVQYLGFSDQQAGYVASAEMWGIAATTVAMTFLAARLNWRHVFAASLLLIVAGNLASLAVSDVATFAALRFLAGVGSGGVVSLSFTVVGLTRNPERNFGWLIMWVLVFGALVLPAMPLAYERVGMSGVIGFFALLAACGLPFVRYLPVSGEEHVQVEADAVDIGWTFKGMALAAMHSYFLAQGVIWAYLFLIGVAGGATEQQVANGLGISQWLGVAGAFTAAMLGIRWGRARPLGASILMTLLPLACLFGPSGALVFGVVVGIYNYGWNMTHPFLLAAMASFDRSGRVVVHAVALQMLGLAIGPAIAATVVGDGNYGAVLWLGMALFAASLALILPPVLRQARLARAAIVPAGPAPHPPLH